MIAGATLGGVLALLALISLCLVAKRRRQRKEDDAIRWPEIADQAALYPEQTHATGRAGIGGDEMEETGHGGGGMMAAGWGAGAAGVGAGRYNSTSSAGRQPMLPAVPPSIYSSEESPYSGYSSTPYAPPQSSYAGNGYSQQGSTHSHAALAPGPASIEYNRAAIERTTPSPPRPYTGGGSSNGHADPVGSGVLPFPGTDLGQEEIERPSSPTPMQVGGAFGGGYDESEGGKRWRLSIVNDDPKN